MRNILSEQHTVTDDPGSKPDQKYALSEQHTVTDDPGSKPDQKYARRRDRQNYMGRISKRKFACTIYWYIVRVWTSRLLVLSL